MIILTIIGARPQFIKAAVVSRAFKEHRSDIKEIIIHTGQHYDGNMSKIFFHELGIPQPDYNLQIGGGTHGQNTGQMIEKIEETLLKVKPDWVLVYGDTDSTLAGALSAVKLHIPVAHIEAGLRSFNRRMPEEINRVLTDHIADLLFTPTDSATRNLTDEGISGMKVQQVGDVMYDAALYYAERAEQRSRILETERLKSKNYILATIHRAENTDDPIRMQNILAGFAESEMTIVWPVHPRTRKRIIEFGLQMPLIIKAIEPIGYLDMIMLEKHAGMIATDSGGIQKEAYFHKVPCMTLRDETEWVELIECGANILVGADRNKIISAYNGKYEVKRFDINIYGSGDAGKTITKQL